ncbi:MAG: hypothetical protein PCFJNLEI_00093 [Verrucomicrobiae bacterium]|nr:hypothetical protein [Verrucomicrobiae bacterium]
MTTPLRAGAAKTNISPALGIQIAGDIGRYRPCTGVADPIYARALALETEGRKFCLLSLDLLAIDDAWTEEIRRRAAQTYGLPAEAVMIHVTQNHGAPCLGNHFCRDSCRLIPEKHAWLRGGDLRYNEPAAAGALDAMGRALGQLTPVTVAAGRAIDGRVAFTRRYVMRDGTALCQPPICDPNILQVEGPADPEVSVVTLTAANGQVVAALLHHTCHPCNGFWGNEAMPDWPGAWCTEMEAHFGPGCTPLVVNGCCGNIIHRNYLNPDEPELKDYRLLGRQLAESTKRALARLTPIPAAPVRWASEILSLPRRPVPTDVLAKAQQLLRANPEPIWKDEIRVTWEWVYAVGIVDIAEEQSRPFPYELQGLRIGDFALLAVGGEPFAETQLGIKRESPFAFTQLAHMSNGFVGYIPTKRALAGGGYETNIGRGSRLHADCAELIEQAGVKFLQKLRQP